MASSSQESAKRPPSFQYPFATSPDIIRAHQKDAFFQSVLHDHLSDILRNVKGARFVQFFGNETRATADLLYLALTTVIGNRTLGEEYCDVVQVEDDTGKLPNVRARAGYILTSVLAPYMLARVLPAFRRRLRAKLDASITSRQRKEKQTLGTPSRITRLQQFILDNLDTITSPAPVYAVSLATFYFTGAYYHLSKRMWGLRYIFTRTSPAHEQRAGYEVLGVLLLMQLALQSYTHLHSTLQNASTSDPDLVVGSTASSANPTTSSAVLPNSGGVEVSLDPNAYTSNNALLLTSEQNNRSHTPDQQKLVQLTKTPLTSIPHFNLDEKLTLPWLEGEQARKCTLCLEPMKDPSVTTCGHVFCWECIGDWCREKPECPLCRQTCLVQHILPLRG
jgi:peroxin-10